MPCRHFPLRHGARALPVALIAAAGLWSCGEDSPPAPPVEGALEWTSPATVGQQLARDLAAAHFDENDLAAARAALAPLVGAGDVAGEDLLRAAIVELALGEHDAARALLDRAAPLAANDPRLWFNRARLARAEQRLEDAVAHLRRTLELSPRDLFTQLVLAIVLHDLESPDAEPALRVLLDQGVEHGGSVYVAACYRMGRLLIEQGRMDDAQTWTDQFQRLQDQGITSPDGEQIERGSFGTVKPSRPRTPPFAAPRPPTAPLSAAQPLLIWPGAHGCVAVALRDDKAERVASGAPVAAKRAPDLLAWGEGGIVVARREGGAPAAPTPIAVDPVATQALAAFDWEKDGDLDLIAMQGAVLRAFRGEPAERAAFVPQATADTALPALPGPATVLQPVDFDHDGDVDLLAIGSFGVELLRDDGFAQGGRFTRVGAEAGVTADGDGDPALSWAAIDDFDGDQDVDLVCGSATRTLLFDNLRGGRFRRLGDVLPAGWHGADAPAIGDLDQDGRPELARAGRIGSFGADFSFAAPAAPGDPAAAATLDLVADLDLDGRLDAVGRRDGALELRFALGSDTPPWRGATLPSRPTACIDHDGDGTFELLLAPHGDAAAAIVALPPPAHGSLRLDLVGVKDNRRGIGALVELRARDAYTRRFWSGGPDTLGVAGQPKADFVRVTWPNGVVQTITDVAAGSARVIEQKEGLVGSCPFLYTWNGTRYEYVTDVLGITPLGLPMAPGQLVPPDHDEYVLIRGEQLAARDGFLDLQITEELREVTYLDRVRLDVVDHPVGSEIFPNERFTFPPFPEARTHVVVAPHGPVRATGSDGGDWTRALGAIDDELAFPFAPYRPAELGETHSPTWGGQFQGLAPAHWLELEFDRAAVAAAPQLRLILTGWFFWTDASVNVAAARTPSIRFEPPLLEVPDRRGGWRAVGPPIGFPAGKQKTMVVDMTALLDRADPRLRLSSTLRLYWDAIRLATDDGMAAMVTTPVEPASARLWERGFSASLVRHGAHHLEWFDWERLEPEARWAQHPGSYTRLGETLPLVTAIDDCFVVMGAGDALHLRFATDGLPPLQSGWRRDYLLFVDGWAKDRDLNTEQALHVEPLPFHGMSGYPYRADERFPDEAHHREWRREWQTRPARSLIPRLAPRAPFAARQELPDESEAPNGTAGAAITER